jgi:hypothetical protein
MCKMSFKHIVGGLYVWLQHVMFFMYLNKMMLRWLEHYHMWIFHGVTKSYYYMHHHSAIINELFRNGKVSHDVL